MMSIRVRVPSSVTSPAGHASRLHRQESSQPALPPLPPRKSAQVEHMTCPDTRWGWRIYLHLPDKLPSFVGKSTMH